MRVRASSILRFDHDSATASERAAQAMLDDFGPDPLTMVLTYGTINHDQATLLQGIRRVVGPDPLIVGCSSQGVLANGALTEEGYGIGIMGLGGRKLVAKTAFEKDICIDTRKKGQRIGQNLKAQVGREPELVGILYDASCGTNVQELLAGMSAELGCPIVGGGASISWGLPVATYQYFDTQALQTSLVAFALSGPFDVEIGVCHGTVSTGVVMTVTRAEGNRILELDGRRAAESFQEATGYVRGEALQQEHLTSWAIAVEIAQGLDQRQTYLIRAATGIDFESGAVSVQAGFPVGTRVAFHHRTIDAVLNGTMEMGQSLVRRMRGRPPWAMLGFECRARTVPFLGQERASKENVDLGAQLGQNVPWLGMLAWGEVAPLNGIAAFHNYTYPIAVLLERE